MKRSVRSTAYAVLERLAAALAAYATIEQTQTDTKREPNDRGKHACHSHSHKVSSRTFFLKTQGKAKRTEEPVARFRDMISGLETDHLRVVWR